MSSAQASTILEVVYPIAPNISRLVTDQRKFDKLVSLTTYYVSSGLESDLILEDSRHVSEANRDLPG